MSEAPTSASQPLARVRRLWWLVLLAAIVAGAGTYVLSTPAAGSATGVINLRPVLPLPNDRLDLIEDLEVSVGQSSVLREPAAQAGLSVDAVRNGLSVERVGSSNLVAVTFAHPDGTAAAEDVIEDVVDSAATFLSGSNDAGLPASMQSALEDAEEAEQEASDAVTDAIVDNGGISPDAEARSLQSQAGPDITPAERETLLTAVNEAQEFDELRARLNQARQSVASLNDLALEMQATDANARLALTVAFQENGTIGALESARLRRAVAAGLVGALVAAAIIALAGRGRSSRSSRRAGG